MFSKLLRNTNKELSKILLESGKNISSIVDLDEVITEFIEYTEREANNIY
ncbi:hypothetical protein [Romboutsia sp.]